MNDMNALSERTEALIQRIADSVIDAGDKVIASAEKVVSISTDAAMQRIDAAVELAQMKATLGLRLAQIEAIGKQKESLAALRAAASERNPAMVRLLDFQMDILSTQEASILEAAGVPVDRALRAIGETDAKLYQRDGRRFTPVAEVAK